MIFYPETLLALPDNSGGTSGGKSLLFIPKSEGKSEKEKGKSGKLEVSCY